jgi:hypothetical protein
MSTRIKSRVILRAGISTSCERARNNTCGLSFGLPQLKHEVFLASRTNGATYGDVLPNCAHQFWSTDAPHFFRTNKLDTTYDTDRQTDTWWRLKRVPYSTRESSSVYVWFFIGYINISCRIADERRKFSYYMSLFLTGSGRLLRLNPVNTSILEYVSEYWRGDLYNAAIQ